MRALAASIAVHVLVLLLFWPAQHEAAPQPRSDATQPPRAEEPPIAVVMLDEPTSHAGGSRGGGAATRTGAARHARVLDGWEQVSIHEEGRQDGLGIGDGEGSGRGHGIGFGDGGGIGRALDVPAVPVPPQPKVSKARPPKLIWPNRDVDVIDDSYLFTAKVTIDKEGAVVGARMVTNRPGSRGERAADAIWSFRYSPALDDDGNPVRSTIEQSFQVR